MPDPSFSRYARGLQVSLAAAKEKIAQAQQSSRRAEVNLGLPTFSSDSGVRPQEAMPRSVS